YEPHHGNLRPDRRPGPGAETGRGNAQGNPDGRRGSRGLPGGRDAGKIPFAAGFGVGLMLQIRNLKCFYGRIMAIKGVSLSVREGEMVCLIGANGSGKTTLLNALCGLLPTWEGEMQFRSRSLEGLSPPAIVRAGISMVPEGRHIFPPMSVK